VNATFFWLVGVPLGMKTIPEYIDSPDHPVVAADIFAREEPDDEEEDEDEDEEDGEDNDEDEEEDEGYSE
jgi:hypothetical protein